jgi:hypothetical protein
MKKLWNAAKAHPFRALYLLGAVCLAAGMLLTFLSDTVFYAAGRLSEQTVTPADTGLYQLVNMTQDGNVFTADTGDAQFLLAPGQRIRTLRLKAEYLTPESNEMDLYYHLPGMGYSARLRVWPALSEDGQSWIYRLPPVAGRNIRLDLADQSGVALRMDEIIINEKPAWYSYFLPSLWQLLWLGVLPGLAGCAVLLVREPGRQNHNRQKGSAT